MNNQYLNNIPSTLLLVSMAVLLSACSDDIADLEQYVAQVKARPAGIVEPIPELRPYRKFEYPQHTKDPFDGSILKPKVSAPAFEQGISLDRNRVPEFLEGFPLDSFIMVGTVKQSGIHWGLVKIPDGTIHRVKAGNYMGQNFGKIILIEEGRISLKEVISNGLGGYKEHDNSIALSDPSSM